MIDDARSGGADDAASVARTGPTDPDFEVLFSNAAPSLVAWTRLRLRGLESIGIDVEDVAQETWTRAFEGFARFDAQRASFRSWVISIARNVLLENVRRSSAQRRARGSAGHSSLLSKCPDSVTTFTRAVAQDEALTRLLEFVELLPNEDRDLVVLRGLEELPFEEVAARLNLTEDATIKRWTRLCTRIRERRSFAQLFG